MPWRRRFSSRSEHPAPSRQTHSKCANAVCAPLRGATVPGPVNSHVVSLCRQMFITPMRSSWGGGGWGLVKCLTPALCRVRPLNHTSVVGDSAPCPRPHLNLNLFPATAAVTEPSGARIYFLAWQQTSGGLKVIIYRATYHLLAKRCCFLQN